jgi:cellulose synthase/poly-beta-1,6-N-acetylglucosamine synthase-like glycosyltransferase
VLLAGACAWIAQYLNPQKTMLKNKMLWIGAGIGAAAVLLLFPIVHAVVVVANFAVHLLVLGLQLLCARLPKFRPEQQRDIDEETFVSIHVPAYDEPPEVLSETLRALSRLRWRNYEVLVIDNNTPDESVWRPIEALCEELGPKFRFFHVENMEGAKAGALNHIRRFMNPRAEYIFVVDADYVVFRGALRRALAYFTAPDIGLVQFPQEYRNISRGNMGLALDFKHFFAGYMNMANHLGCVPSTGTLTVIRVDAMAMVNGFDTQVVTEDAELGFRLNLQGFRSVFANEVIGRGLMPHDLESLKKQRWRWAFGNAQILKLNWRRILFGPELNWRQKLGYLSHLTAWFNFNLIPSLSLILIAPLAFIDGITLLQHYIVILSGFTLTTFMVLRFGTLFYSLRHEGHSVREIWLAYLTHLGLGWVFSASWLKCLFDHRSPFVRTNKFLSRKLPGVVTTTLAELVLGVAMLLACAILTVTDFVLGPVAALLMCSSRFLVYWVWLQTRRTMDVTERLSNELLRRVSPARRNARATAPEEDYLLADPIESSSVI